VPFGFGLGELQRPQRSPDGIVDHFRLGFLLAPTSSVNHDQQVAVGHLGCLHPPSDPATAKVTNRSVQPSGVQGAFISGIFPFEKLPVVERALCRLISRNRCSPTRGRRPARVGSGAGATIIRAFHGQGRSTGTPRPLPRTDAGSGDRPEGTRAVRGVATGGEPPRCSRTTGQVPGRGRTALAGIPSRMRIGPCGCTRELSRAAGRHGRGQIEKEGKDRRATSGELSPPSGGSYRSALGILVHRPPRLHFECAQTPLIQPGSSRI